MESRSRLLAMGLVVGLAFAGWAAAETPRELVDTYDNIATAILANKSAERSVVAAILASAYGHAEATLAKAQTKIATGQPARTELEELAALVTQLGNEGDASVAAIRKRLVEGGHHHHHAKAEQEGQYDEGFVIVTRQAKKAFLDAAATIGKMAAKPDGVALDAAWKTVSDQYRELMKGA